MNKTCDACKLYKDCKKPFIQSVSSTTRPKLICILPYPEKEDEEVPFSGDGATILKAALGDYENQVYITYLNKCVTYKNAISQGDVKEPSTESLENCLNHLKRELKQFSGCTIMVFGSLSYRLITGDKSPIGQVTGIKKSVTLGGFTYSVIPNVDPRATMIDSSMATDFKRIISTALMPTEEVVVKSDYIILDPQSAISELQRVIDLYKKKEIESVVFDIETSKSMDQWAGGEIIMISIAHSKDPRGMAIPLTISNENHHKNYPYPVTDIPFEVTERDKKKILMKCGEMLETVPIVGHNLLYDFKWCSWFGVGDLRKYKIKMDTYNVSVQMQGVGAGVSNSLKDLSRRYFSVPEDWDIEISEYLKRFKLIKDKHYGQIPTSILGKYASLDVFYNKMLFEYMDKNCTPNQKKVGALVSSGILPFVDANTKGIYIDPVMMKFLGEGYTHYLADKEEQIKNLPVIKKFVADELVPVLDKNQKKRKPKTTEELKEEILNLNSPKKMQTLIFDEKYYFAPSKKEYLTDSGSISVGKDVREDLTNIVWADNKLESLRSKKDPNVEKWTEGKEFLKIWGKHRRINKLKSSYIDSMPEQMYGGLYRPPFKLNGTVTGRLSSPFHTLPNSSDIKRLISSRWENEGGFILAADESQLELRIVAALSGETKLIEAFKNGHDIHTFAGSQIYNIPYEQVTSVQRTVGKTANFAMLYGSTPESLAETLKISVIEAKNLLKSFFASLGTLTAWMSEMREKTKKSGVADTIMGRRIPIHTAFSKRDRDIAETERLAVNYRVQSPASDLVFDSVVRIWRRKEEEGLKSAFLACVHDSVEYDVYPTEIFSLMKILKEEAQDKLPELFPWVVCPLKMDFEMGTSWGSAFKCEVDQLTDTFLKMKVKGLSCDIDKFVNVAKKAYHVSLEILSEEDIDPQSWKDDNLVRDLTKKKVIISLSSTLD